MQHRPRDLKYGRQPPRDLCRTVRQQPVITEVDRLAEDMDTNNHHDEAGPTEEPGHNRTQCQQVHGHDRDSVFPSDLPLHDGIGHGEPRLIIFLDC